jgi:NTE family protein
MNKQAEILKAELELRRTGPVDSLASASRTKASPPARVVTLATLSRSLPDRLIACALARSLHAETGESVLLVQMDTTEASVSVRDFATIQPGLNGEFCFAEFLQDTEGGFKRLGLHMTGEAHELGWVKPLLEHLGRHFRFVLLHADVHAPVQGLFECLAHSDSTYLFVQQSTENLYNFDLLFREIRSRFNGDFDRLHTVLCLADGERAQMSSAFGREIGGLLHFVVHGCPRAEENHDAGTARGLFAGDLRRLAREIGQCRIGLALSSGGAKGLAHVGVIQVLEENGIEVDVVAGCSMGAYVAAIWGYGCDGKAMEKLAREVEGRWGVWRLVDPVFPPREGFIRGQAVKKRLQRTIGDVQFSELERPIRVVATNLYTLDRVVFSSGDVASAVHASAAIPGVCAPVVIDGETYVDGGIADPLPVDVLEEMGINRIIAVNMIPTPAYMRCCLEMEREQESLYGRRHNFLKALNRHANYFAPGNILDIMMRAVHGSQIRVAEEACRHADVVLRPLAMDARWYEFDKPCKYIALGRRVAEEHLEEIKSLVNKRTVSHEPEIANNPMAGLA